MPEATGYINRSNTICHYTRFFRFLESNCNGCNVGDPKMVELLHLFAENGLRQGRRQKPIVCPTLSANFFGPAAYLLCKPWPDFSSTSDLPCAASGAVRCSPWSPWHRSLSASAPIPPSSP